MNPLPFAELHETHTGVVILIGDRAYKVKKPVDMGFLDFSTAAQREIACRREVQLNRRLAPDVYLGVAELQLPDGHCTEPVVMMRRMPADARLASRVTRGAVDVADMRAIARVVNDFHEHAQRGVEISLEATEDALRRRWATNLDELTRFVGAPLDPAVVDAVQWDALEYVAGRGPLFTSRIEAERIVDGHGDLLADDVFLLSDGPRLLDCLEFDDRLRYLDRIDDIAFLAMDLERLGAAELASALVDAYREYSADSAPGSLVHHYIAYRASVRAKVACLRHEQGDAAARQSAINLIGLAADHLRQAASRLILVGGPPGTGKSTLSHAIADALGYVVISTDRVRKELAGIDPDRSAAAEYGTGLYAPAQVHRTYAEVMSRAETALGLGESVVLDASWNSTVERHAAAEVAKRTSSSLIPFQCAAPGHLAADRIRHRRGPSDATAEVAERMRAEFAAWPGATVVDTADGLDRARDHALQVISVRRRADEEQG